MKPLEDTMNRTTAVTAGLVICTLLGLLELVGLAGINSKDAPPAAVVISGGALGVITLVGVFLAWQGKRAGVITAVGSRLVSAALGIPVFFTEAPNWARVVVAIAIAATLAAVVLLSGAMRQRSLAGSAT
jgi:hypothetical protein